MLSSEFVLRPRRSKERKVACWVQLELINYLQVSFLINEHPLVNVFSIVLGPSVGIAEMCPSEER